MTGVKKISMNKKSSVFWIASLLLFALLSSKLTHVSASEVGSSSGDENNEEENVFNNADENYDNDDDYDEEEEPHAQQDEDIFNPDQVVNSNSAVAIYFNIIINEANSIPRGILQNWDTEQLAQVLALPHGARLVATRPQDFFAIDQGFIVISDIHQNFFDSVRLFEADVAEDVNMSLIPAEMIKRIVLAHSMERKLNLNQFIELFPDFDPALTLQLDPVYQLPHLFQFPQLVYPNHSVGRGMVFNPDGAWTVNDYFIWNLSMQILIVTMVDSSLHQSMDSAEDVKTVILNNLRAARASHFAGCNINYFGLVDNEIIPLNQVFNADGSFVTLQELALTMNDMFLSAGLGTFSTVNYEDLTSDKRIIYRLLAYLAMKNPSLMSEKDRSKMLVDLVRSAHSNDFTSAEIFFFVSGCIKSSLGDIVGSIFRTSPNSRFAKFMEPFLKIRPDQFNSLVQSTTGAAEKIALIRRLPHNLTEGITVTNEEAFKIAQMTKVTRNSPDQDSSNLLSHFLNEEQLRPVHSDRFESMANVKYSVPCPDKDFLNARFDNWMQNLDSNDFGESAWKSHLSELSPEKVNEYKGHEATLDEFVRKTFIVARYMQKTPSTDVQIVFNDSPSFGDGPKNEALEMLTRALLLPRYKVFYYNSQIVGFVPYPLLHPDIMAVLGFLNGWFIEADMPINWSLSPDYIKFLFYEEDPSQSMQQVIEHFYGPLFDNLDTLVDRYTNPLDYFTTVFHTHQPLALSSNGSARPLDLFAPFDTAKSTFFGLSAFMDEESLALLDEAIEIPVSKNIMAMEESKVESDVLIESKTNDDPSAAFVDDSAYEEACQRLHRQLALKHNLVKVMKHAVSQEIIEHFLLARFAFIREFFKVFNTLSSQHITADLYKTLQESFNTAITVQDLIEGFRFDNERLDIQVIDVQTGHVFSPRKTLTLVLESLDPKLLKTFYWFCTGCISLPLGGLDKNPIKVDIYEDTLLLPSSATCFRTFKFHIHSTLAANIGAMRTALLESSGYQYIEGRNQRSAAASAATNILNALTNAATAVGADTTTAATDNSNSVDLEEN